MSKKTFKYLFVIISLVSVAALSMWLLRRPDERLGFVSNQIEVARQVTNLATGSNLDHTKKVTEIVYRASYERTIERARQYLPGHGYKEVRFPLKSWIIFESKANDSVAIIPGNRLEASPGRASKEYVTVLLISSVDEILGQLKSQIR